MKNLILRIGLISAAIASTSFFSAAARAEGVDTALSSSAFGFYNSLKPDVQKLVQQDANALADLRYNMTALHKYLPADSLSLVRSYVGMGHPISTTEVERGRIISYLTNPYELKKLSPVHQQVARQLAAVLKNQPVTAAPGWTGTEAFKEVARWAGERSLVYTMSGPTTAPYPGAATPRDIIVLSGDKIPVMVNTAKGKGPFNPVALRLSDVSGRVDQRTLREAWKQISDKGIPLIQNANSPATGRHVTTAAEEVAHAAQNATRVAVRTAPRETLREAAQQSRAVPLLGIGAALITATYYGTDYLDKTAERELMARAKEDARLRRIPEVEQQFIESEIGKLASVLLTKEDFEKFRKDYFHSKRSDKEIFDELREKYSRHNKCDFEAADVVQSLTVWDDDLHVDIRYTKPEPGKPAQPYPVARPSSFAPNKWAKERFEQLNAPNQDFKMRMGVVDCVLAKNPEALTSIRRDMQAKAAQDKRLDDLVADMKRREAFEASLGLTGSK